MASAARQATTIPPLRATSSSPENLNTKTQRAQRRPLLGLPPFPPGGGEGAAPYQLLLCVLCAFVFFSSLCAPGADRLSNLRQLARDRIEDAGRRWLGLLFLAQPLAERLAERQLHGIVLPGRQV